MLITYYFFLATTFFLGDCRVAAFLAGVFLMIFLAITFLAGAFAMGLAVVTIIGLVILLATSLLPRYFESSNARIGMKMIFNNVIPIPYAQCFQNFFAMLK